MQLAIFDIFRLPQTPDLMLFVAAAVALSWGPYLKDRSRVVFLPPASSRELAALSPLYPTPVDVSI